MTHKHHIIPRHMGGTDDPSNLVELSISEHAKAHRVLYEKYGKIQDKIAWLMLSGKTAEAENLRLFLANSAFQEFLLDTVRRDAWANKISETLRGHQQTEETKQKRSDSMKQTYQNNPELRHQRSIDSKQHSDEYRARMINGLAQKMSDARKTSEKWQAAVRSSECRQKKSLSSPRRRDVVVQGHIYHGLREAARQTGHGYTKLRTLLITNADPNFIRYL